MKFLSLLLLFSAIMVYIAPEDNVDKRTISKFDIENLLGNWYEIARFDNRFERGLIDVSATYFIDNKGKIRVENRGVDSLTQKEKKTLGKVKLTSTPGHLRVSFFWIFYSDYNILEMDTKEGWMLVGGSSDKYLWIMSRHPTIQESTLKQILDLAKIRGYDTDKLIYTR